MSNSQPFVTVSAYKNVMLAITVSTALRGAVTDALGACDPVCGMCLEHCKDGWSGDRCDQTVCEAGLMPPTCERGMPNVNGRVDKLHV